ncbi:MAG TPA: hypothetical protein VG168_03700 [Bryobacteraceae bacterium]|jgi:hypothetical protein|nr:hypothetical protein [Bryobacteraceae bacterium]
MPQRHDVTCGGDSTSTLSGKAGFGVASAPSSNSITDLQVGPIDRVAPDTPASFVDE